MLERMTSILGTIKQKLGSNQHCLFDILSPDVETYATIYHLVHTFLGAGGGGALFENF